MILDPCFGYLTPVVVLTPVVDPCSLELTIAEDSETGTYASRPSGEVHGPFIADGDVLIMEMSFPSQSIE